MYFVVIFAFSMGVRRLEHHLGRTGETTKG
jgi:hypothetical protein